MLALVVGAAVIGACAQKRTQPTAKSAAPKATAVAPPPAASQEEQPREKNPRFGEAVTYVDGKCVGVIRVTELPTSLKAHTYELADGYHRTKYGFLEYARALGLDTKRVKAMHLYGGSRVVVVDRAELDRIGEKIMFSFTQGDRGKPRVYWPSVKLNVNTTIEMLSNVIFYIDKAPPVLKDGDLFYPDGAAVEEKVPYADQEQGNGTRVYVDGALVGTVKRKKLGSDIASTTSPDKFSLFAYATKLNPEVKNAKTVDLVAGDDVVARLDPATTKDTTFNVPPKNRGQAVVDVPTNDGAQPARISAVQIFVKSAPPTRPLTKISDAPEARPSASGKSGSDEEP